MSIGERLREERERLGFAQPAFAGLAETTKKSQIDYEKDLTQPKAGYLAAIAKVGADIQYIVTGVRSTTALTVDENELLVRYRNAPIDVKAAVIGALSAGAMSQKTVRKEQVFHGDVGQAIKVEGNLDQTGIRFFKKGNKKK